MERSNTLPVPSTSAPDEPAPAKPLTTAERRYVALVAMGSSGTVAYQAAFRCKETSAQVGSSRLRHRPHIAAAIEAATRARLQELAPVAVARLGSLLTAESERVQLEATKAALDRTGFAPTRIDGAGGNGAAITINIAAPDAVSVTLRNP